MINITLPFPNEQNWGTITISRPVITISPPTKGVGIFFKVFKNLNFTEDYIVFHDVVS